MSTDRLIIAVPSKGRLQENTNAFFERAGLPVLQPGGARNYRGRLGGIDDVEIAFLSASEIAQNLRDGKVDLGVTGQDLLTEKIPPDDKAVHLLVRLGFGPADVVVAVPECWLDVATMADLDEIAESFYERHGRRLRVATKYHNLTRRFFAEKGVTGYRIVESLGATEGAPAAGIAEIIVDITTTGATLAANALKILDDGVILKSCAVLAGRLEGLEDARAKRLIAVLSAIT